MEIEIILGVNEDRDAILDSAFHDLVQVFDLRDPSSMLLGRRVTKRETTATRSHSSF